MKKFQVIKTYLTTLESIIEAENKSDAHSIAHNMSKDEYEYEDQDIPDVMVKEITE
jgi:hypothetical protein